jgi:tRNA(Ile)-lysidine synthase
MKNDISSYLKTQLHLSLKLEDLATKPILLAYSGGIDSQALFLLLLEMRSQIPLDLHVVHIDHKWRSTSAKESYALQEFVENSGVVFHLVTLDKDKQPLADLENYFRQERYKAFLKIYQEISAGCLLIAHHQDDQAETVFKRLFEGASFIKLSGLKRESYLHGMRVIRPLLECNKQHLEAYLAFKKSGYIQDITNTDTRYLRARQRHQIFPIIEKLFGKNATKNLSKIARKALHLEFYLDAQTEKYQKYIYAGPFGVSIDFTKEPFEPIECEHVIKKLLRIYSMEMSCQTLEDVIEKIHLRQANKRFLCSGLEVFVDRGAIYFIEALRPQIFPESIFWDFQEIVFESQDYLWHLKPVEIETLETSWKDLYIGEIYLDLEEGQIFIANATTDRKAMNKGFSENQVPAFIRSLAPVFFKNGLVISNPWIKTSKKLKEKKAVKLVCRAKNGGRLNFNGLKSTPLLSSKS